MASVLRDVNTCYVPGPVQVTLQALNILIFTIIYEMVPSLFLPNRYGNRDTQLDGLPKPQS